MKARSEKQLALPGLKGGSAFKPTRPERTLDAILRLAGSDRCWRNDGLRQSTLRLYGLYLLRYERAAAASGRPSLRVMTKEDSVAWMGAIRHELSTTDWENCHAAFRQWFRRRDGDYPKLKCAPLPAPPEPPARQRWWLAILLAIVRFGVRILHVGHRRRAGERLRSNTDLAPR